MADPTIVVKGRYDGSSLDSGLRGTQSRLVSAGKTGRTFGQTMARAGKAAALGLAGGLLAAGAAAIKFGQAAADDEAAASLLEGALKRNAKATDEQVAATERWITSQGKLLGVTDDELRPALSTLVTSTKDVGKAQKLASLAMDISAAKGKSLESVATALMKANNGQVSSLSRLGINTKNAAGETVTMAEATKLMTAQFGGAAAGKADTLTGKMARLKVQLSEAGEEIGAALLPALSDLAPYIVKAVEATIKWSQTNIAPMLKQVAEFVVENKDEIADFAGTVKDTALPPLKLLGSVVGDLVGFFAGLPGPVKSVGIEVALAAVAIAKLSPILTSVKTAGVGFVGTMKDAETRTQKLGQAARVAGGVAGMVLLAEGAKRADSGVGTLLTTAGGFATGFAVAGPVGGAIGGAVGLFTGLQRSVEASQQAFRDSIVLNEDYAASFDAVTGAITKATKQSIFKNAVNNDQISIARMIGIPDRAVVQAIAGNVEQLEAIIARVNKLTGTRKQLSGPDADLFFFNKQSASDFIASLKYGEQQLTAEQRAFIKALEAAKSFKEQLKGLPPKSITEFKALGIAPAAAEVAALAKKYGLIDNKQIKTILKAVGGDATVKDVQRIIAKLNEVDPTGERANRALARVGSKPGDLGPFLGGLQRGVDRAAQIAGSGGSRAGNNLGSGLAAGLRNWVGDVQRAAANLANIAVAAVDKAAENNSPSKRTTKSGEYLGQGLARGMGNATPEAVRAATKMLDSVLGAVDAGSKGTSKAVDLITKAVERAVKLKDDKKEAAREREILASVRDRVKQIREAGKAQDALNEKLRTERDNLRGLIEQRRQYAETISEGIRNYSSLTSLLSSDEGAVNDAGALLERLRQRLADTTTFSGLLDSLRSGGLSEALVQQLANAGVEGGLAIAQAIEAGGPAAIAEFTTIQDQIDRVAAHIGTTTAAGLYDAGIASAQGLVAGLESQQAELEKWARKLARTLIRSLKDELGIKSPSTVAEEIGVNMLRGIKLGLSDTHAKSIGSSTAAALVDGFGTPTLRARATLSDSGGGSAVGGNTYHITANVPLGTSAAAVGSEIVDKIKAFEKSGGRALATG